MGCFFSSCAEGEVVLPDVFADLQEVYDTGRHLLYVACPVREVTRS